MWHQSENSRAKVHYQDIINDYNDPTLVNKSLFMNELVAHVVSLSLFVSFRIIFKYNQSRYLNLNLTLNLKANIYFSSYF